MNTQFKKLALALVTLSGLSLAALSITSAPARAHVVCDEDGYDCHQVPDWYGRQGNVVCDEDGDDCYRAPNWYGRYDDWRWQQHEWEEQRAREAYHSWYWGEPYYRDYYYSRPTASFWFGF